MIVSLFFNKPYRDSVACYVPEELKGKISLYARVMVDDRGEHIPGLVVHVYSGASEKEKNALQPVLRVIDKRAVLNADQYDLAERMVRHYLCAKGEALFKMIPRGRRFSEFELRAADQKKELPELNAEQKTIVESILRTAGKNGAPALHLIHGVTGSGKTRIYLELIREYLKLELSVIFLLPEIALSYQFLNDLKPEFGDEMAILHSGLGNGYRFSEYMRVMNREARLVVGTRSAIFAPVTDLGLVILDEEHDSSYKENSNPRYHAKWAAFERLSHGEWPFALPRTIVMGSATPAVETTYLAERGMAMRHRLTKRATGFDLPEIHVPRYDTADTGADVFSPLLVEKMREHLERGNQVMLLLNRRGYANYAFCPVCEESAQCPRCSVALTYHKTTKTQAGVKGAAGEFQLKCHLCSYQETYRDRCPVCHARRKLIGKGIQRVDDAMDFHFPEIAYARLDQDTANAQKDYSEDVIMAMREKRIRVLIGTQMIAKGFDMPGVTLVGLLNADAGLALPDYRAAERVFQLLVQASGRAGRHGRGEVIVQTMQPHHYAIENALAGDYDSFYRTELELRRTIHFPPFGRIFRVVCRSEDEARVWRLAYRIRDLIREMSNENSLFETEAPVDLPEQIDGPVEAPLYKIKEEYRVHFIARDRKLERLQRFGAVIQRFMLTGHHDLKGVNLEWEFDPVDLL